MRKNLFWFFNKSANLNLLRKSDVNAYFQQAATRGNASDIRQLLRTISFPNLKEAFLHTANFLPIEVKRFWEDFFGNINSPTIC